jgi:putative ABC transport system permease protein
MNTFWQDIQFTLRGLKRSPGFAAAAIGTLALGIGATTAIFSTVNAALLKPLPYPNPDGIYAARTALTDGRVTTGLLSDVELSRLNDPSLSIAKAVGLQTQQLTLMREDGTPSPVTAYGVTEGFFEMFGLPMTQGSGFKPEHMPNNAPPPVVISHRVWRDHFGSDPAIVGKPIRFAEFPSTILGVAHPDFDTPHGANYWFGLRLNPTGVGHIYEGYMRVKPGTTPERLRAEGDQVITGIRKDFAESVRSRVFEFRPLVEQEVGDLRAILIVVLSATALLLVLACVNVTNLLLARGASRAQEMAVRVSLGAGRGRLVRQLLTESIVLATAGAVAGLAVAYAGVRLILAAGAKELPRLHTISFDRNVLLFAFATLIVSGLIVGFAPALRLARSDLRSLMNESGRSASAGRATARWLSALTVAEIALGVTLVAGAGWLVRSFENLRGVSPGFVATDRVVFDAVFTGPRYQNGQAVNAAADDLLDRIRKVSGVIAVGATAQLPLKRVPENSIFVEFNGEPMDQNRPNGSRQRVISRGYLETAGTKLLAGRDFNADDRQGVTPARVLVNQTFVTRYLKDRDPIGIKFRWGYPNINPNTESEIIGVVEDVRQIALHTPGEPCFYSVDTQFPGRRRTVVVHARGGDSPALQQSIRDIVRAVDSNMPVEFQTMSGLAGATLLRQELGMMLMLVFGATALALAAVGIYGVIAYATSQRRGEVATRLALGATPRNVFWLVLKEGQTLTIIGTVIGLGASYAAGRFIASRLYEVSASDPMILIGATLVVALLASVATMIPALRASKTKPSDVLRS